MQRRRTASTSRFRTLASDADAHPCARNHHPHVFPRRRRASPTVFYPGAQHAHASPKDDACTCSLRGCTRCADGVPITSASNVRCPPNLRRDPHRTSAQCGQAGYTMGSRGAHDAAYVGWLRSWPADGLAGTWCERNNRRALMRLGSRCRWGGRDVGLLGGGSRRPRSGRRQWSRIDGGPGRGASTRGPVPWCTSIGGSGQRCDGACWNR